MKVTVIRKVGNVEQTLVFEFEKTEVDAFTKESILRLLLILIGGEHQFGQQQQQ